MLIVILISKAIPILIGSICTLIIIKDTKVNNNKETATKATNSYLDSDNDNDSFTPYSYWKYFY